MLYKFQSGIYILDIFFFIYLLIFIFLIKELASIKMHWIQTMIDKLNKA